MLPIQVLSGSSYQDMADESLLDRQKMKDMKEEHEDAMNEG